MTDSQPSSGRTGDWIHRPGSARICGQIRNRSVTECLGIQDHQFWLHLMGILPQIQISDLVDIDEQCVKQTRLLLTMSTRIPDPTRIQITPHDSTFRAHSLIRLGPPLGWELHFRSACTVRAYPTRYPHHGGPRERGGCSCWPITHTQLRSHPFPLPVRPSPTSPPSMSTPLH